MRSKAQIGKKIVLLTKKEKIICLPAYISNIHLLAKNNQSPDRRQSLAPYFCPPFLKCYFHLFFTPIPGIFTNLTSRLRCAKHHPLSLGVQPLMGDKPIPGAQPPNFLPRPSSPQLSSPTAWHLCPHFYEAHAHALCRAAWLEQPLTTLLWKWTTRTRACLHEPRGPNWKWAGGKTVACSGQEQKAYRSHHLSSRAEHVFVLPHWKKDTKSTNAKRTGTDWHCYLGIVDSLFLLSNQRELWLTPKNFFFLKGKRLFDQ